MKIYLEYKNLELSKNLKSKRPLFYLKNVSPIFIPLKTKTSLINYPLHDYIIKSPPILSKKSITKFGDKLLLLKDYIDKQIEVEGWISIEDIKIFCLEVTKITRSIKDCVNLVRRLLEDKEYTIKYPITDLFTFNDDENEDSEQNYRFESGIIAQSKVEWYFEQTTQFFIASKHSRDYKEFVKKHGEDPDQLEFFI